MVRNMAPSDVAHDFVVGDRLLWLAICLHAIMEPENNSAAHDAENSGNKAVYKTGHGRQQHPTGKCKRNALMLEIGFPEGARMIEKKPSKHVGLSATENDNQL